MVGLTDHLDMTIAIDWGVNHKPTKQTNKTSGKTNSIIFVSEINSEKRDPPQ